MLLPLHGKYGRGKFAVIDDEDSWVRHFRWVVDANGYVIRWNGGKKFKLANEIMEPPSGLMVDHKNLDKLDNRRSNLRVLTRAQNCQNVPRRNPVSGHRGVQRGSKGWRGVVRHQGIFFTTPSFKTIEEANEAVIELRKKILPYSYEGGNE